LPPTREVLIGFGANVPGPAGSPRDSIVAAADALRGALSVVGIATPLANPAYPEGAGPEFLNSALLAETSLAPEVVLELLLGTEPALGRVREQPWQPRPIDIDLLVYGDLVTDGFWEAAAPGDKPPLAPAFVVPHPRLHYRAFVLQPLAEIAPS